MRYELLAKLDETLWVVRVNPRDLKPQDMNARTMPRDMFRQLAENIKSRGTVESLPFCWLNAADEVIEIVSGHHRVNACIDAQIESVPILLETRQLTKSQLRSKQLSHNSLAGADNPQVLKALYHEIDDLEERIRAYLDARTFDDLDLQPVKAIDVKVDTEMVYVGIAFLPHQAKDFEQLLLKIGEAKRLYVENAESYELFRDAVHRIREEVEVKKLGNVLGEMVRLASARLDETTAVPAGGDLS